MGVDDRVRRNRSVDSCCSFIFLGFGEIEFC